MKTKMILVGVFSLLVMTNCNNGDDDQNTPENPNCDKSIAINEVAYNEDSQSPYQIMDYTIEEDCLTIEFGASGCDGNSWQVSLVDSGSLTDEVVPERMLKLKLVNNEVCDAYFTKSYSFDLIPLRVSNSQQISLAIDGTSTPVLYSY